MNAEDVILEVSHLEKSFGSHDVLRDISFQVAKGDVVSVIGASGSGKSTMLRCVSLLETPTGGSILYPVSYTHLMMQRMKIQEIQQLEIPVIRIFRELNSGTI